MRGSPLRGGDDDDVDFIPLWPGPASRWDMLRYALWQLLYA